MGTRGMMAFKHGGNVKAMYNHWDSYPDGLGKDIAKWIATADLEEAAQQVDALEEIDPSVSPTDEQKESLKQYADLGVSSRSLDDWYTLLRDTQGNPALTLEAGFYENGLNIGGQEWGYVIDLDKQELEVCKCGYEPEEYGAEDPDLGLSSLGNDYDLVRRIPFDDIRKGVVDWDSMEQELSGEEY